MSATVGKLDQEVTPEARETAARISALMRHLFRYDRGTMLRTLEESGLSTTQTKALLEIGGLGDETEPRHVSELAEALGVSVPSMSRAVDGLVRRKLATRVEDTADRRVRRVAITTRGRKLVETLLLIRQAGMEAFAESLSAAERRKLDAAVDALMGREDIAAAYLRLKDGAGR